MWHSTSHYKMKTAVVTLGGGGLKKLSAPLQLSDPKDKYKVCTNETLKYVHETTVAVEKQ
jgi:hypothetical protein